MALFVDKLRQVVKNITGSVIIDQKTVKEVIKEIQRALILADVSPKLVFELSKNIEEKTKKTEQLQGVSPKEQLVKTVYDELVALLGGKEKHEPRMDPHKILLCGIYGQGKTTTVGKLAKYYMKHGKSVVAICCDVDRPAAYQQLKQLCEKIGTPFYGNAEAKDSAKVLKEALSKIKKADIIIVDSAGRNALDNQLKNELSKIHDLLSPQETYLVLGADLGAATSKQATAFKETVPITGVIITRMDSSGKAGGALSACAETKVPVTFIGTGEKLEDFEEFESEAFVSRMLGFGDLGGLIKKVRDAATEAEFDPNAIIEGKFNLKIFYQQIKAMKKMGPLRKVMEMMGLVDIPEDVLNMSQEKMQSFQHIMDSMTKQELEEPEIVSSSRTKRISKGSGRPEKEVKELLSQYKHAKKMLKGFKGGKIPRKFRKLMGGGKLPPGLALK